MDQSPMQPSGPEAPLRVRAFPQGPDLWRIDWFGVVEYIDRQRRTGQPSVLVHLSKVIASDALTHPDVLLQASATAKYQRKCWVSLGTLTLLRVGDIWRDQVLVATPGYQEEVFRDVVVSESTVEMMPAGASLQPGVFFLPLAEHPWHLGNTHSYCLRVALPDGRSMIIPCMELIRFYFGSSGALLSRLFVLPLTKNALFTSVSIHPVTRVMNLCLAEGIPKASKEDVARIAGCKEAWYAAQTVAPSLQRAASAKTDPYPQCRFPFQGTTTLSATGKWLSLGDKAGQTFVVFHLNSCSHEFPYSKLFFTQAGPGGDLAALNAVPLEPGHSPQLAKPVKTPEKPGLIDQNPSNALKPTEQVVPRRRRFTDLDNKPTRRGRKFTRRRPVFTSGAAVQGVSDLADGAPFGSSPRVRCVELVEASGANDMPPPEFLEPVVTAIESIDRIDCTLLTGSDEDGWTVPMHLLFDDDGVIADELLIEHLGHTVPRRVAAFRLGLRGAILVLVVVEGNRFVPLLYPLGQGHRDDPWPYVEHAAADYIVRLHKDGEPDPGPGAPAKPAAEAVARWLHDSFVTSQGTLPVDKPHRGVAMVMEWLTRHVVALAKGLMARI